MATKKKMLQAAAGQAGGAALDITDVFSTYLYDGTGAAQTITNGIDLAGEGGLVWLKSRSNIYDNWLYDTVRGNTVRLISNSTAAQGSTGANGITSFNSDGFGLGAPFTEINGSGSTFASWTFRKAPKFFDVVTWTGTGAGARAINHNLGSVPGMIIVKWYNTSGDNWTVYHRGLNGGTDPEDYGIYLNLTNAAINESGFWNDTAPTATQFTVGGSLNSGFGGGGQYVAYVFAHNNGDGEFGPDGDQDIIKCGSYVGNGSDNGPEINLGFEPQWFMFKKTTGTGGGWFMYDTMRGFAVDPAGGPYIWANTSDVEADSNRLNPTATGVKIHDSNNSWNEPGATFIYMAIRRGPLAQPESGTEVFATSFYGSGADSKPPAYRSPFAVDTALQLLRNGANVIYPFMLSRLTGTGYLTTSSTNAEGSSSTNTFDYNNGYNSNAPASEDTVVLGHMFRRAPGFFDVVAYSGTGSAQTINHNLGVVPEMVWVKSRNNTTSSWSVTSTELGAGYRMFLTSASGSNADTSYDNGQTPTETVFYRGAEDSQGGTNYIAYLFATLPGVSKVGSFTATGSDVSVDCGFTSGARFVLIKRTNTADDWFVFDTARGIVAGNDKRLKLNATTAEATADNIDPYTAGFTMTSGILGSAGNTYIFYAIA